ncbi:hypothetical protein GQ607_009657 [Colletotrichum asianum]|uniref:Ankyrin repeat protein n=1 Tax=Colletotrichum asianum TaxID=702518 RepID=A0A8H3W862_9PEZI|nr:hypothetical protein GQ607_009657 [Colletotrichum asianum]
MDNQPGSVFWWQKADEIPLETWEHIASYVTDPKSLAAMARVNHKLRYVCDPKLYNSAVDEGRIQDAVLLAAAEGNLATLQKAKRYGAAFNKTTPLAEPFEWVLNLWEEMMARDGPLSHKPDFTPPDAGWATPLHVAAMNGHYHVVAWLLDEDVDIEAPARFCCECLPLVVQDPTNPTRYLGDYPAWTPLHYAICKGHSSVARLLLSAGASYGNLCVPQSSGRWYKRPYNRSIGGRAIGRFYCYPHLGDQENDISGHVAAIHTAAATGNKAIMSHLVEGLGVDIHSKDEGNAAPIHYAVLAPNASMVSHAIQLGADVHSGYCPRTVSKHSSGWDHRRIIPMCEKTPLEPLHWALLWKKTETVRELALNGACWPKESSDGVSTHAHITRILKIIDDSAPRPVAPQGSYLRLLERASARSEHLQLLMDSVSSNLPELLNWTWNVGRASRDRFQMVSEFQLAFFYACQIPDIDEAVLRQFRDCLGLVMGQKDFDMSEHYVYSDLEAERKLWVHQDAHPAKSKYPIGTLAICHTVSHMPRSFEEDMLRRLRWLLDARAKPTSPRQPLSPLVCLFNRIRAEDLKYDWYNKPNDTEYHDSWCAFLPIVELLGDNGAWQPFDNDRIEGTLLVLAAYFGMVRQLSRTSAKAAAEFHRQVLEKMPAEVRKMAEVAQLITEEPEGQASPPTD